MRAIERGIGICIILLAGACINALRAQERIPGPSMLPEKLYPLFIGWQAGAEFYLPTKENRRIRTLNVNAAVGVMLIRDLRLSLYGGVTGTYAWGTITQQVDGVGDTVLESTSAGIGPFLLLRWEPFHIGAVSFHLNASEGVILYSRHFPAGGDIYNFMFRTGPDIALRTDNGRTFIVAGYRWMHVSNGQGLGTFNPSYEGGGLELSVMRRF